ncbi:MAG: O-antigen ligase family protein [Acidimicrobiales bacterium]
MASTARPHRDATRRPRSTPWDTAGLVIVAALAGWTLVASAGRPWARPLPVLALLGCSVALFALGRVGAGRDDDLVPRLVALGIGGAFLITFPGVMSSGGAPTEYGNTNGTLAALGVIAAAAVVPSARGTARRGWVALAAALLACVVMSESVAAGVALSVALALAVVAMLRRDAAVAALGGLVTTWLALGGSTALAAGAEQPIGGHEQALRIELWGRALDLARDAPLRGRGPGSYAPPTHAFAFDLDLRWAHQEYLQQAAEVGVVGLVLLLVLGAWLFTYLWWGRGRGLVRTVAGASAVTVVALHATVDHVLHAAVVPLTLAVLVGWATADPRRRDIRG